MEDRRSPSKIRPDQSASSERTSWLANASISSSDSVEESGRRCRSCLRIWREDPLRVQIASTQKSKAYRSTSFEDRLPDGESWRGFAGLLLVGIMYRSGSLPIVFPTGSRKDRPILCASCYDVFPSRGIHFTQSGWIGSGWVGSNRPCTESEQEVSFVSFVRARRGDPGLSCSVGWGALSSSRFPSIPSNPPISSSPLSSESTACIRGSRPPIRSPGLDLLLSLPPSRSLSPSSSCGRRERQREEREEKWREARLGSISTANNVERGGAAAALLLRATSTRHQTSSWRSRRAYASSAPSTSARNLDPRKEPRKEAPNQAACSAHCVGRRVERNVAPNVALNVEPSRKHRREETTNVHCGFPTPKHPNGWMDPSQVIVDSIQQVSPSQPSTCSSTWTRSIRTR